MKKKLQVFISSTFIDLIEERQSAVEAVLGSGHIPAGMELFKAGDESQKETIKRWINESDVYLLILGGRYGSIEPVSGKSYTHWEYDYAGEVGIPRFAVVIKEKALEEKFKKLGRSAIELENRGEYEEFKKLVLSKTSEFFYDCKDIKITIHRQLAELILKKDLHGWISAKEINSNELLTQEVIRLTQENKNLKEKLDKLKSNEIKNKKSTNKLSLLIEKRITLENLEKRVDRILQIFNTEEQEEDEPIIWTEGEGNDEYDVVLPAPRSSFIPYFRMKDDFIDEVMLINIITSSKQKYNDALADIRVMLSEQKDIKHDVNIKFIIVIPEENEEKINIAKRFFDNALNSANINNNSKLYSIDVWDENRLIQIEKELCLTIVE